MSKSLRDEIEEIVTRWHDTNVFAHPCTDQILQAVKDSLPEEVDADGSTGKWPNGYNQYRAEVIKRLGLE